MDIRTHGKGFDAARERATAENNFRVIYARPPKVEDVFDGGLLLTWATEDGKHHYEKFDMVVLSQGLESPDDAEQLAQAAGIDLEQVPLCPDRHTYAPLATSRPVSMWAAPFRGQKTSPIRSPRRAGQPLSVQGNWPQARGTEMTKAVFPGRTRHLQGRTPHRRLCLPLRHQYRRRRRCAGGARLRQGPARRGLFHRQPLLLLPGYPAASGQHHPANTGSTGSWSPPAPRAPTNRSSRTPCGRRA